MTMFRSISMAMLLFTLVLFISMVSSSASPEADFVRKTVSAHKIVIFSKSYCPYCMRAKSVFKELGHVPYVMELDEREDGGHSIQSALKEIVGRQTVPQVFVKGKHIGGSDDTMDALASGELGGLLDVSEKTTAEL